MFKNSTLNYYSTNAEIAYLISENFFDGKHFVWCSPVFNPEDCDQFDIHKKIPYGSSPHGIYSLLKKEITTNDKHGLKIQGIKTGLIKGVGLKRIDGIIDDEQYRHIMEMIEEADLSHFTPLLYIISKEKINDTRLIKVPVKDSGNSLSTEYQIHDLRSNEFDKIKF